MRAQNQKMKKNKSVGKKQISKTNTIDKSITLKPKNNKNKAKSKNKVIKTKTKLNLVNSKSKPKPKSKLINIDNSNLELGLDKNIKNNYTDSNNNNFTSTNNYENIYKSFVNEDINNLNNCMNSYGVLPNYNNINIENLSSSNNLLTSNQCKEKQITLKKAMDRLLINSQNILEKQNNILTECDLLTKNSMTNDYAIRNLLNNENNYNYENLMKKYTNNISEILSKIKKSNIDFETNMKLKNENESLKNKLEMAKIDREDNIQNKINELSTLKIVLISEINHVINFLKNIGYDNLPLEKIETNNLTSQKITDFFQTIIKIIKQMKELLRNKETIISKMTIDQATNRSGYNSNLDNIINKSCEKLSLDYNNIGFKTYNFSVRNNIHNKSYNISFRNFQKNNDLIEKTQKSLNVNDFINNNYLLSKDENIEKLKYKQYEINIKNEENKNNDSFNKIKEDNIIYDINSGKEIEKYNISSNNERDKNYETGNFAFQNILNNNKNK